MCTNWYIYEEISSYVSICDAISQNNKIINERRPRMPSTVPEPQAQALESSASDYIDAVNERTRFVRIA